MSDGLTQEVARAADQLIATLQERTSGSLDYSEGSLAVIEELLDEASNFAGDMSPEQLQGLSQDFGCYILEVARREFGGRYAWFEQRDQPVLVVGEPAFRVALLAWDKVKGRLSGDKADNIPFFYSGFAERARRATPGDDVLYV
ncbi:MAG: hypothetical protein JOZ51_22415 [Chloroflexi bacterium]|nr:hypothetical protein [Chloroflexota bacterium]